MKVTILLFRNTKTYRHLSISETLLNYGNFLARRGRIGLETNGKVRALDYTRTGVASGLLSRATGPRPQGTPKTKIAKVTGTVVPSRAHTATSKFATVPLFSGQLS